MASREKGPPGPGNPGAQLRWVVRFLLEERRDPELGIEYDLGLLRLVMRRCGEVRQGADQAALLRDCQQELDAKGRHPGRVATVNTILAHLVAANLRGLAEQGVTPGEAEEGFRGAAEYEAGRERLEP